MRSDNGYIILPRALLGDDVCDTSNSFIVYVKLCLMANWKDSETDLLKHKIRLKPGQLCTSLDELKTLTKLPKSSIGRTLKQLKDDGLIESQVGRKGTIITICNWENIQNPNSYNQSQVNHERDNSETQMGLRWDYKNEETGKKKQKQNYEGINTLVETSVSPPPKKYISLVEFWNDMASKNGLAKVKVDLLSKSKSRLKKIKCRLDEHPELEFWQELFGSIPRSDFLLGKNEKNWKVTFDWLMTNDVNYAKVADGNYFKQARDKFDLNNPDWDAMTTKEMVEFHERTGKLPPM